MLLLLMQNSCIRNDPQKETASKTDQKRIPPGPDWLEAYASHTKRSDPGPYAELYEALPFALDSLCHVIKTLLIHPLEAREMGLETEDFSHEGKARTCEEMLKTLLLIEDKGLNFPRKAENRLVAGCYHHAMLLTSVLRQRHIPVRMRAGFARYYEKDYGIRFGHVICEVWDKDREEWILVDPDRERIGLGPGDMDFGADAWMNIREKRVKESVYTSSVGRGLKGVLNLLTLDASLLLQQEKMYYNYARIAMNDISRLPEIDPERKAILDELARLSLTADAHMEDLRSLYQETDFLQPSGLDYQAFIRMILDHE